MLREEADNILRVILDLGEAMMKSGAENWRTEDSLYRLCHAYGFKKVNIWLIPTNIQATIRTENNDTITHIRYVSSGGADYVKLDLLNDLSRRICAETPSAEEFEIQLQEILAIPPQKRWKKYLAAMIGAGCFAGFFNGDVLDAFVACVVAVVMTALGERLADKEPNPLIYNAILSFCAEILIIFAVQLEIGHHPSSITIGIAMLLIGGVGITNGIRDLFNKDIISGILNISTAVLGAAGIAIGIALPIMLFKGVM